MNIYPGAHRAWEGKWNLDLEEGTFLPSLGPHSLGLELIDITQLLLYGGAAMFLPQAVWELIRKLALNGGWDYGPGPVGSQKSCSKEQK